MQSIAQSPGTELERITRGACTDLTSRRFGYEDCIIHGKAGTDHALPSFLTSLGTVPVFPSVARYGRWGNAGETPAVQGESGRLQVKLLALDTKKTVAFSLWRLDIRSTVAYTKVRTVRYARKVGFRCGK
jgi:hypothetical protein